MVSSRSFNKIIGVGFQKTGTSTLGRMMQILGYLNYGYDVNLMNEIMNGQYDKVLKRIYKWDSFQDNPWCII